MEDSAFVWAARQHGEVVLARGCVRTAPGQWSNLSFLFVMRNYMMLCLWILGLVSPTTLHAWYYPGRPLPLTPTYAVIRSGGAAMRVAV